jgi:predicted aspartyl protease
VRGSRRRDTLKCEKYDGSMSWDIFMSHFDTVRRYNRWGEEEALAQLKAALRGAAAQVLLLDRVQRFTLSTLRTALQQRFGDAQQASRYRTELRNRRRQPGETLQELYIAISRLAILAHPGAQTELSHRLAVEAYIDSLNDRHLEERVADTAPATLEEAYGTAIRLEANSREKRSSRERHDENKRWEKKAYQLKSQEETEPTEGEQIKELKEQIGRLQAELARRPTTLHAQEARTTEPAARAGGRFNGGQVGYPARNGPIPSTRPVICYGCRGYGHVVRNCPNIGGQGGTGPTQYQANGVHLAASTLNGAGQARKTYLSLRVNDKWQQLMLDSGCQKSLLASRLVEPRLIQPTEQRVFAANGTGIHVSGEATVTIQLGRIKTRLHVLISDEIDDGLLGEDWLRGEGIVWDFKRASICHAGHVYRLTTARTQNQGPAADRNRRYESERRNPRPVRERATTTRGAQAPGHVTRRRQEETVRQPGGRIDRHFQSSAEAEDKSSAGSHVIRRNEIVIHPTDYDTRSRGRRKPYARPSAFH